MLILVCLVTTGCVDHATPPPATSPPSNDNRSGQRSWSPYTIRYYPITIAACVDGRFGDKSSWFLSVNSSGKAEVTIKSSTGDVRREFSVTDLSLRLFRELLIRERFFDLEREYGDSVPDGSTTIVSVVVGDLSQTVRVRYYMDLIENPESDELQEIVRVLRVVEKLRHWFGDKDAVYLGNYRMKAMEAAGTKEKRNRRVSQDGARGENESPKNDE